MKEEIIGSPDLEGIIRIVEGHDRSWVTSSDTSKEDPFSKHFKFDPSEYRTIRDEDRSAVLSSYHKRGDGTYTTAHAAASPKKGTLTVDDVKKMYELSRKMEDSVMVKREFAKEYEAEPFTREAKADLVIDDSPKTDSAEVGSW